MRDIPFWFSFVALGMLVAGSDGADWRFRGCA